MTLAFPGPTHLEVLPLEALNRGRPFTVHTLLVVGIFFCVLCEKEWEALMTSGFLGLQCDPHPGSLILVPDVGARVFTNMSPQDA